MQPEIYDEYLRVIQECVENDNICHFDKTLFSEEPSDTVSLVIKNYQAKGGMSRYVSEQMDGVTKSGGVKESEVELALF